MITIHEWAAGCENLIEGLVEVMEEIYIVVEIVENPPLSRLLLLVSSPSQAPSSLQRNYLFTLLVSFPLGLMHEWFCW